MCPDAWPERLAESAGDFGRAIDEALDQCRRELAMVRGGTVSNWTKTNVFGGTEPVTAADLAVQLRLVRAVNRVLPGVPVIAEEGRQHLGAVPGNCVIIDPIDGTVPFLRGSPVYTVSVCLVVNGHPACAIVDLPGYDVRVTAHSGRGLAIRGDVARLPAYGPRSILASPAQTARVRDAARLIAFGVSPVPTTSAKILFVALSRACAAVRIRGSTAVAPWDYAAAALIAREAGAVASDDHDRDLCSRVAMPVSGWFACRRPGPDAMLRQIVAGRDADAL